MQAMQQVALWDQERWGQGRQQLQVLELKGQRQQRQQQLQQQQQRPQQLLLQVCPLRKLEELVLSGPHCG